MTQKFVLERIHRNTSEKELLEDLIRVSQKVGRNQISTKEYNQLGVFTSSTYKNRFGSFILALEKAGLSPLNNRNVTKEELIDDLERVIAETGHKQISREEYIKRGKYSFEPFRRVFKTWSNAVKEVGLNPRNYNISDEDCFKNIEDIWVQLGRQPRYSEMIKPFSKYSGRLYVNRFGTWTKALEAFVENINSGVQTENVFDEEENIECETKEKFITVQRHKTKREIGWRLRFLVLRRDNFKCVSCGKSPATNVNTELHVDHIIPWNKFGETVIENLQTLCVECNIGKSNLDWKE
ncbi:MAG: HNH endonuclease [Bacteroidia bacterium]|nr:HNH endonuclease [Bacteroidia bacterium]